LWRDRALVFLAPTGISWVKVGSRIKRRVRAKAVVECDPAYGPESWQGAAAALCTQIDAWRREALDVTVVVSNHFVRYVIVPPSSDINGIEEARALARFHFAKVHGERARSWDVRLGDPPHARAPQLASAMDAGLLPALRACFSPQGRSRLVSVQPYLMSAFNCWRREVPDRGAWLLLLEPERACLALLSGPGWTAVQNLKGSFSEPDECTALVERERWRANVPNPPEIVLIPETSVDGLDRPSGDRWKYIKNAARWPDRLTLPHDAPYAAALTAL
jgi:hypothetical protein